MNIINLTDLAMAMGKKRRNKHNAKPVTIDGIRFHSTGEGNRYVYLKDLENKGRIINLMLQVKYPIYINDIKVFSYNADFVYEVDRKIVVEDYKGFKTAMYRLKKKCVEASYGIQIQEVTNAVQAC
jgi:hypothetical protein